MVNVDLYSAIITKVSNALDTLVSGEQTGFQTLSEGLVVLLCAEVVRQRFELHLDSVQLNVISYHIISYHIISGISSAPITKRT